MYYDSLISITDDEIVFKLYYFPTGKKKVVSLTNIERIMVKPPTLWSGKWRLFGTGNFKTWFPADYNRPRRDRIFIAILKDQWIDIGFTVEDADSVEKMLKDRGLIKVE